MYQAKYKNVTVIHEDRVTAVVNAIEIAGDIMHIREVPGKDPDGMFKRCAIIELQFRNRTEQTVAKSMYEEQEDEERLPTPFALHQEWAGKKNAFKPNYEARLYTEAFKKLTKDVCDDDGRVVKKALLSIKEVEAKAPAAPATT